MTEHYNILAPGPSIVYADIKRMKPGWCVAVNGAYFFANSSGFVDSIDVFCVRDEHYVFSALDKMVSICELRKIDTPIVWTYIKYRPVIMKQYPDLIVSYFSCNQSHLMRAIPYPSRRLRVSTTLSFAIAGTLIEDTDSIDLYGVDMRGYGYGHEVTYDRQWKKPRWKFERPELALQIKEAKQNGVRIRRRFHEKQECAA